jgi:hypothetical protein
MTNLEVTPEVLEAIDFLMDNNMKISNEEILRVIEEKKEAEKKEAEEKAKADEKEAEEEKEYLGKTLAVYGTARVGRIVKVIDFMGDVIQETEKAVKVEGYHENKGFTRWFPKSVLLADEDDFDTSDIDLIFRDLPSWFVRKN